MNNLAILNSHDRDKRISFDEGPHIYTIDGDSKYMSVTTWNNSHFPEFNADKVINKMIRGRNWAKNKLYGKTPQEIKNIWEANRDEAASAGTKLHYDIEAYYNDCPNDNDSIEYKYFLEYANKFSYLKPYRTEWMIWDNELKFAGSIDMVYENPDGTLMIYDWKRSKNIEKFPRFNEYSHTECISHIPHTNFWHYSLQLNTYKAIIEKNYGKKVTTLMLVCLHPNQKSYELFKVPDLQNEVNELFNLRKSMKINT